MERIHYLLAQYLSNKATPAEAQEMLQWLRQNPDSAPVLQDAWEKDPQPAPAADLQRMWAVVGPATAPAPRRLTWRMAAVGAAAAAVLAIAGTYSYLYITRSSLQPGAAATVPFIAPGSNGAILTLADGSKVSLDSAATGVVAVQNGAAVVYNQQQLQYHMPGKPAADIFNNVSTPRGRQFHLQLPDGSQVWLNAASSIHFPTAFTGAERRVQVTGEVYFEIAANAAKPFFVETPASEIAVLGTSFNVNAYADEAFEKTTLLTGKVAEAPLKRMDGRVILAPGEQGRLSSNGALGIVRKVDTDQVLAWKNGAFNFQDMSLREVMRQLARWYNLDIVYEQGVPDMHFGGEMSRNVPLADLLDGLKAMGIHFRVEGRTLTVSP